MCESVSNWKQAGKVIQGMLNPRKFSFGATSAIVTSRELIIGLGAAHARVCTIISSLLIVGLADNKTDSLSIHIYQEAENLEERTALVVTLMNFAARFISALSFVAIVLALPEAYASMAVLSWGCLLLAAISYVLARARSVDPLPELGRHLVVAFLVIGASRIIGAWISYHVH